jgi:hypothetical protein
MGNIYRDDERAPEVGSHLIVVGMQAVSIVRQGAVKANEQAETE